MRIVLVVAVLGGCWISRTERSATTEGRRSERQDPVVLSSTVPTTRATRRSYTPLDPEMAATLRKAAPQVLPPMMKGALVVLDLNAKTVNTHCGEAARWIVQWISDRLIDPAIPDVECVKRTRDAHCWQLVPAQPRPHPDSLVLYFHPDELVGVTIGPLGSERSDLWPEFEHQLANRTCP